MPPQIQVKLLRALEEREIERLGSNRPVRIDVRIMAATNRVLSEEVRMWRFRFDLYYRLQAYELSVPPLRERRADIRQHAAHFAARFARGRSPRDSRRRRYTLWKATRGHWRELAHAIEFAVNTCPGGVVRTEDLPERVRRCFAGAEGTRGGGVSPGALSLRVAPLSLEERWHAETQRFKAGRAEAAQRNVAECCGNKARAARDLGITRQWLYKLLAAAQAEG